MPSVDAIMQLTADVSRAGDTITTMRDAAGAMGAAFRAAAAPVDCRGVPDSLLHTTLAIGTADRVRDQDRTE